MHMSDSSAQSRCSFILEVSEERSDYITDKLREFNRSKTSQRSSIPTQPSASLEIYALEDEGSIVGGLIGRTNEIPEWLEITTIWVEVDMRGQGMGRRMMDLAEEEAIRRCCRYAHLATSDYQAPDFYCRIGFRQYGELENCPRSETVYYFFKELV